MLVDLAQVVELDHPDRDSFAPVLPAASDGAAFSVRWAGSFDADSDGTLLAGDAVVTTKQEALVDVLTQREIVWRPPAYYTIDWDAAGRSVALLATNWGSSARNASTLPECALK